MDKERSRRLTYSASIVVMAVALGASVPMAQATDEQVRSSPKDRTDYVRNLAPGEGVAGRRFDLATTAGTGTPDLPGFFISDVVVDNTDANLTNTDTANDGETSIAINPEDRDEIVISSFSSGWAAGNAIIYHSTDGGLTWSQEGVPPPPGWDSTLCPCDWAWDWGAGDALVGTFLARLATGFDVTSATSTDATSPAAFTYNGNPAQRTNNNVPGSFTNADQPWLLANLDPAAPAQENVYVAWDDFNNTDGVSGVDMRVAVSANASPLDFTSDQQVGNSAGAVNPGLRLADGRGDGTMWALFGRNIAAGAGGSKNMDYMLNRSTDGGLTWTLNGDPNLPTTGGIVVANADSTQPTAKFGTVNALLGGVHHAGVDPLSGDLYYVYGNRDSGTGNERLAIRRITDAGGGNVAVGAESFVTGQVNAALPQVAVLDNGTLGVFYYTFDGIDAGSGFPQFTAHLATSVDQGATFTDATLVTFLSSATDNGNNRQRVLGDYMQMKALGNCFFGSFTANGAEFGRSISNHDPIFFKTCDPNCGDGSIEGSETCDDGNATAGDGCSATCAIETGYQCTGQPSVCTPICGDSLVVGNETCDDGNLVNGDCCSSTCQLQDCTIAVTKDAFLRKQPHNTNEGGNTILTVRNRKNRTLVGFDLTGKNVAALNSATLVFTVKKNLRGWRAAGKDIEVHALLDDFAEGNGQLLGSPVPTRGTGAGVTNECATDADIANVSTDCAIEWGGGNFVAAPTDSVTHFNSTSGQVSYDVTADVQAAVDGWLLKRAVERGSGGVNYYSREGAAAEGDPALAPKLLLDY